MTNILENLYDIVMSGVCISAIIAALFYWYAISRDMNDKDDFDKKYRESRKDNKLSLKITVLKNLGMAIEPMPMFKMVNT